MTDMAALVAAISPDTSLFRVDGSHISSFNHISKPKVVQRKSCSTWDQDRSWLASISADLQVQRDKGLDRCSLAGHISTADALSSRLAGARVLIPGIDAHTRRDEILSGVLLVRSFAREVSGFQTMAKIQRKRFSREQQTTPTPYAEWGAAFQAYYNSGGQPPPGYFPPSVGSGPQPHPYMWGGQPMMPGYGTPAPPYGAMYPHGGIYSHPSLPPGAHPYSQYGMPSPGGAIASEATATTPASAEGEGTKVADRLKKRGSAKKSKGGSDGGKGNSGSADGVFSQSGETGSEGSSEGSEEDNNSQNIMRQRSFEQMSVDGAIVVSGGGPPAYSAQQPPGGAFMNLSMGQAGAPGAPFGMPGKGSGGSATNLAAMSNTGKKGKRPSASSSGPMVPTTPGTPMKGSTGREGVPAELWLQDEREVKRQRRKQSNRESARRSRLRKQAECEELGTRVDTLTVENMALRTELARVSEECKKMKAENATLLAQLRNQANSTNGTEEVGEEALAMKTESNGKEQEADTPNQNNRKTEEEEAPASSPTKTPASTDAPATATAEPATAVAAG
ncbi:hypothetical protein R1sor_010857 [Riccia sorocarpa]|uniref:BZIP domain-containing protein n=1 Tax=Riccia sorocarpa TaxID=122646 RepID=A0ABD3I0N5_9MARC